MERHFDASLRELKEKLIGMAGWVEKAIEGATHALEAQDRQTINQVFEFEKKVNQAHIDVDNACLRLLALQQPLAADLRLIIAVLKINTDLERMADQAVNIAHNSDRYLKQAPIKPLVDLPVMFQEVRWMVRETINAFVKQDQKLANQVLLRDDRVDSLKNKIFRDVLEILRSRPDQIEQGLNLILIARNLERIGDHATNIAEDVIFAITGEDIRHSMRPESIKEALK